MLRLYHLCHELCDCSRRDKLTGGTGRLQLSQDFFINKAESMAFLDIVKFDFINHINDLTEINTVLHIVVGVLKGLEFHDCFLNRVSA